MNLFSFAKVYPFLILHCINGFQFTTPSSSYKNTVAFTSTSSTLSLSNDNNNDSFDDFDPRNSPHSYSKDKNIKKDADLKPTGSSMDLTKSFSKSKTKKNEKELHANTSVEKETNNDNSDNSDNMAQLNTPSLEKNENSVDDDNIFDLFDPRISPHMYPNGIPESSLSTTSTSTSTSTSISTSTVSKTSSQLDKQSKIGILLIDHGSRKDASNELLHTIASLYQNSPKCPPHFIVKAAHMEIAPPSIEEGIRDLLFSTSGDVKQIICHPYFLSPGRHVTEDIPHLVEQAKLNILKDNEHLSNLQIVTTQHTGSRLKVMIDAIASIVEGSVKSDLTNVDSDTNNMGFFGDIMKMMEEQTATEEK